MAGRDPYHARHGARYAAPPGNPLNAELQREVQRARFRTVIPPAPGMPEDMPKAGAFLVLDPTREVTASEVRLAADKVERAHSLGLSALVLAQDGEQRDAFRAELLDLLTKRRLAQQAAVWGRA